MSEDYCTASKVRYSIFTPRCQWHLKVRIFEFSIPISSRNLSQSQNYLNMSPKWFSFTKKYRVTISWQFRFKYKILLGFVFAEFIKTTIIQSSQRRNSLKKYIRIEDILTQWGYHKTWLKATRGPWLEGKTQWWPNIDACPTLVQIITRLFCCRKS